ncbi:MAG: peptidoglycan-binding protein [Clostridiales bacterium]|jgi:hypothetical protein|nr:peptidoglycan-binding protein [Clostridiales bacterium]
MALTGNGRLRVDVSAGGLGMPASGALIRVTPRGESMNIIEEIVADSSGQSPVLNLPAPSPDFSMLPAASGERPYTEYDVLVTKEGYEDCEVRGVQVLPNATASQPVTLTPLSVQGGAQDIINIAEHTLWGQYPPKIPEEAVKELPAPSGFVVLSEALIPEYMIVHTGTPSNASSAHYTVPFRDYIKNVASSEIFANWPEETLKANVLAITSFALNRVYTEWYKSQGYSFTITNSTAYDQAFNYGRNIFVEISRVVDDLFTNFITKPNISQPLMTQYCDGRKVSCPGWMTQWGSKDLGDQGYSAMDILKRYYGYDIYLMQAKSVAGIPSSYPGTPLQMWSSGENVRTLQRQLNTISNNYPLIKKVPVDGQFGDSTRQAVETFQDIFSLPSDGVVGQSTWYKISYIYVAVTKMAETKVSVG